MAQPATMAVVLDSVADVLTRDVVSPTSTTYTLSSHEVRTPRGITVKRVIPTSQDLDYKLRTGVKFYWSERVGTGADEKLYTAYHNQDWAIPLGMSADGALRIIELVQSVMNTGTSGFLLHSLVTKQTT